MSEATTARRWFHAAAWCGLAATTYTNYQAAPSADLRVGYLAVPVLLAFVSEGLIRTWRALPSRPRNLLIALTFALVCVSYEHFVHMILTAGGTDFAAWVGGAVIDATIFGCVLATCVLTLPEQNSTPEQNVLVVPAEQNSTPEQNVLVVPERLELPAQNQNTGTEPAQPEQNTSTPEQNQNSTPTRRSQNDADALIALGEAFGQDVPTTREAMRALACGVSRAERLVKLKYGDARNEART